MVNQTSCSQKVRHTINTHVQACTLHTLRGSQSPLRKITRKIRKLVVLSTSMYAHTYIVKMYLLLYCIAGHTNWLEFKFGDFIWFAK